jgi:hypothetical protein
MFHEANYYKGSNILCSEVNSKGIAPLSFTKEND